MGAFIDRLDELHVPPPYDLGTDALAYPYQSHGFFVKSRRDVLQAIADRYLNGPLPGNAPHYVVPEGPFGSHVYVSFNHYARAQSQDQPNRGWLAYTEVLITYLVLDIGSGGLPRAAWHLPLVYIAPARVAGPGAVPIVLGREIYGFAKSPSLIEYEPTTPWSFAGSRLDVFDWDPAADYRLHPRVALDIVSGFPIWPFFVSAAAGGPWPPGGSPLPEPPAPRGDGPRATHPAGPDDFRTRFLTDALAETPGAVDILEEPEPGKPYPVRTPNLLLPDHPGIDVGVVAFAGGLSLEAPLVALRQFRRPDDYAQAAFQEVVETPIAIRNPAFGYFFAPLRARFHPLNRVSIGHRLGFPPSAVDADGRFVFDLPIVYYWRGQLEFGDPGSVATYPVP